MKISYNWLRQFIETNKTAEEISKLLTDIGLEVESLDHIQAVAGGLEGLVVGEVRSCWQHPNADRLRVTLVDIGAGQELQIVCGAPNVRVGQKVVVAPVGTTVHPLTGEPFKITRSKIRGEVSEGMICAEDEISLGHSHDGIMVLDPHAPVGRQAKSWFNLEGDRVFEIGLTPNRADAASHLGVARDLAAVLRIPVKMPEISASIADDHSLPIPVVVENESACPRYSSVTVAGVTVAESPSWLKEKLNVIGVRPINNVVDITNYVLHELGQPLHAFDADEIKGGKVLVKNCPEGTVFTTLDGATRTLSSEDLMICNAEEPMCIGGVFGGLTSGVKESTRNIFLESAWFNAVSVRKTAKRHGLKTDASFRFERGTDPEMTVFALKRAALLIREIAGGTISSEISDFYPVPQPPATIAVSYKNIDRLIGKAIPHDEIRAILSASGITIKASLEEGLLLDVPAYKVDVTREVDVIEEVLRLYGYNNIEIPSQIRASLNYAPKPDKESIRNQVADMLTANGFYEILTNSLTRSAYSLDSEKEVKILNPLSSDLDTMRQSLLFSGLEVIAYNQNRKSADLRLYEFGKTYQLDGEGYKESHRLCVFLTGMTSAGQWNQRLASHSFFTLKAVVDRVIGRLNIKGLLSTDHADPNLQYGLSYRRGEKTLVSFGSVAKKALKLADNSKEVFYADFDWDLVLKTIRGNKITYKEVSKFPSVRRDLSVLLDRSVTFADLKRIASSSEKKILKEVTIFDVYEGEKLAPGKKSYALNFVLQDEEKTLNDQQIDATMQKIIANFEKEAGAEIRK
ncbi:phenylalanine--tRNA ligase subunit beta [Hufsiella ginkgonis]|uniref:Phenylalanine--tRNA ligase beta subunit n=1 Tax=Hufsiella ginkgonis TaxID=2695274 RepID=A0A7K1XRW5_9SPHI|nr:phenylalanine--tRNA ligase subunit beta [Hufsiella ginkgonis]MXV13690.1 phenylalanine--tRNA ligase subunit beta [Hufsiella ginkgonis]